MILKLFKLRTYKNLFRFIRTGKYYVVCGKDLHNNFWVYGVHLDEDNAYRIAEALREKFGDKEAHVRILFKGFE